MPEKTTGGGSFLSVRGQGRRPASIRCLQGRCLRLAPLICVAGLLALLVSAISPADDLVQPDFSPNFRSGQRIVAASRLLQIPLLHKRHCAGAAVALGANAKSAFQPAGDAAPVLSARLTPTRPERSHAGRAPPAFFTHSA